MTKEWWVKIINHSIRQQEHLNKLHVVKMKMFIFLDDNRNIIFCFEICFCFDIHLCFRVRFSTFWRWQKNDEYELSIIRFDSKNIWASFTSWKWKRSSFSMICVIIFLFRNMLLIWYLFMIFFSRHFLLSFDDVRIYLWLLDVLRLERIK